MTSILTDLVLQTKDRAKATKLYESYYEGTAELSFIGEPLQHEFGEKLKHTFVNRCAPIIDTTLDRLEVIGFESEDGHEDKEANTVWKEPDLSRIARAAHFDALVSGNGWVLVWPEHDEIHVMAQEPEDIAVIWSAENPNILEAASKVWRLRDGRWRLNIYTATTLEKHITMGPHAAPPETESAWAQHQDDGDTAWPIPHTLGRVPIFHLATVHKPATYGRSDLAPILPLQDRLNLSLANQTVIEESMSYPQRWATGIQSVIDHETGEFVTPFDAGADKLWIASDPESRFGSFTPADLTQLETVLEGHELRIARTARVPMHHLIQTGQPPSGEALKTAEAPFVAKVQARQNAFGDTWVELVSFILHIRNAASSRGRLSTLWKSAETRSEQTELEHGLMKIAMGISKRQVARELGYTNTQIDTFESERQLEADEIAEQALRSFNGL